MRKRNNLTEEEKKEIELWIYRRKQYHITVPIIADWSGYHPQHLYAVERFVYPMNDRLRTAYKKVINSFKRKVGKNVKYTKRCEK